MISRVQDSPPAGGTVGFAAPKSYFRYPVLKEAKWSWTEILYLFLGGLSAGAFVVATLTDLFGRSEDQPVARAGRYLALASIAFSPLLLIAGIGRPERFLNMLRIIKTRSPMSMGTWGLAAFGAFVGLGAFRQALEDGLFGQNVAARYFARVPLPVFGILGSLFSFFVGSYTGVLLSFTNVPVWAKNHLLQGPLFLTSALSTGLAAISLALTGRKAVSPETQSWLKKTENAANLAEVGLLAGALSTLGPLARPLFRQDLGVPFWFGTIGGGLILPTILRLRAPTTPNGLRSAQNIIASILVLVGSLIYRAVTIEAGRESARNPSDYLLLTGSERTVTERS